MPKLALAPVEEPPYLTHGTDVSAKYKGAFCEAKIIDVNKHVKLRVLFDGGSGTHLIDDTDVKTGSTLEVGTKIEAKHPEKKQNFVQATITKILDHSRYTVIFDDGDQCILRRNSLCLKSGKHFAESETLDRLPLTNPEHFGNPVKVESSIGSAAANISKPHNDKLKGEPSAQVSIETNNIESNNTETSSKGKKPCMEVGARLMVQYSKGKVQNVYEAKVLKIDTNAAGKTRFFVHYLGWNNRYDEWITRGRILNIVSDKAEIIPKSVPKGQAEAPVPPNAPSIEAPKTVVTKSATTSSSSNHSSATTTLSISSPTNITTTSLVSNHSDSSPTIATSTAIAATVLSTTPAPRLVSKDKEVPAKTRRSRLSDKKVSRPGDPTPEVDSSSATTTTTSSNPITVSASSGSLSVASSVPSTSSTTCIPSSPPRDKEKLIKSRRSKNSGTLERKSSVSSQNDVIPPTIIEKVEDESVNEKPATPKTRRSARPTRKKEIKDSQQSSNAQATSSSDDDAKKSISSNKNNSASSSAGSLDESSQDNNSQSVNSAEQSSVTDPVEEKISPQASESVEATRQQISTVEDADHVDSPPQEKQASKTLIDNLECMPEPTIPAQPVVTPVKEVDMEVDEPTSCGLGEKTEDLDMVPYPSTRPDEQNNASPSSRPIYRFCEEIDESDCDKKISILQERIMALRQTYIALKTELVDLDRRRKRPRTERSNSEHMNCGLVCRN